MIDCVDYVITHKPYHIDESDMYRKLCVGGYTEPGKLSDSTGNNIAEYNDRINELTGLYWIWKNTNSDYVGLSHYRRFFNDNGKRLTEERASDILCSHGYDIILANMVLLPWSISDNIAMAVTKKLSDKAYFAFLDVIREKQPEYADDFTKVFIENKMYVCNLFVTSREIMDEYCRWLFSFLLEATDRIDVSGLITREKRVAGYYAEVLWTLWARQQKLKVYEMPILKG